MKDLYIRIKDKSTKVAKKVTNDEISIADFISNSNNIINYDLKPNFKILDNENNPINIHQRIYELEDIAKKEKIVDENGKEIEYNLIDLTIKKETNKNHNSESNLYIQLVLPEFENGRDDMKIIKNPKIYDNERMSYFFKENPLEEITEMSVGKVLQYMSHRVIDVEQENKDEYIAREFLDRVLHSNIASELEISVGNYKIGMEDKYLKLEDKIPKEYIQKCEIADSEGNKLDYHRIDLCVTRLLNKY